MVYSSYFFAGDEDIVNTEKLHGWDHSSAEEIAEFTREFDQTTKLVIKSDQEPAYIRVGGRRTNSPKYNIAFGKLKLTGYDILRSMPSCPVV